MHPLVEWLIARQKLEGLSDEKFGEKLGYLNRTTWTAYKLGRRKGPAFQLLRGALVAYPDEREKVLSFVLRATIVPCGARIEAVKVRREVARA